MYSVNNPDIIPQKIFPCGAIAKKKHPENIYNLDICESKYNIPKNFPCGAIAKKSRYLTPFRVHARKFYKNVKISRRQFVENENVRDGQIANSTIDVI